MSAFQVKDLFLVWQFSTKNTFQVVILENAYTVNNFIDN